MTRHDFKHGPAAVSPLECGDPIGGPSFDQRDFRNALGSFATGVTVVTTVDAGGRRYAMTVNSFAAVSLSPPLVLWSVSRGSPSAGAFLSATHFAINVLAADQVALSRHFARSSDDKFAAIVTLEGIAGLPLIAGAAAVFQCRTHAIHTGGDHEVILGRVEHYGHSDREPLVFCRGRYQRGVNVEIAADRDADVAAAWGGLA
jgi:flavin reductase (DIM6/NTAB) family NADH-FMN oxidoreductase RutF